jgi:PAS domain S-box-containing protein
VPPTSDPEGSSTSPVDLDELTWEALRTTWDDAPFLAGIVTGRHHHLRYVNRAVTATFGEPVLGIPIAEAFPGMDVTALERFDEVLATGRTIEVARRQLQMRDRSGEDVVIQYMLSPLGPPGHQPLGVVMIAHDVSAQARVERSAARSQLLAQISEQMNATTDPSQALHALTGRLVPDIADVAAVFVTPGELAGTASPGAPIAMTVSDQLKPLGVPPTANGQPGSAPWERMLRAGLPVVIPIDDLSLPTVAPDAPVRRWLSDADVNSLAVVPLVVAGVMTAALVLASAGQREPYAAADLPFLEDIAARAGAAVTHLRRVGLNAMIALELQRALLPVAPPAFPDMTVSGRYIAGVADVDVGGDWWDVVDLGAGQVALGVGDVSGRGVAAAAVMGQARVAMRAAGFAHLSPAEVLAIVDEQVAELVDPAVTVSPSPPRFATALYGVFEPTSAALRLSSAGHLPPLVRSPAGAVHIVDLPPGTPLGLRMAGWEEVLVPFPAGSTIAMFTDGLVESRDQDFDEGVAKLAAAFVELGGLANLDEAADALIEAMGRTREHADDVALVLLRVQASAIPRASFDLTVRHGRAVSEARRSAADFVVASCPARPDVAQHLLQVVSELLANALEHGRGPAVLHVHVTDVRVVVEVTDQAVARPVRRQPVPGAERGRGLAVTEALSSRWGVRLGPQGKTVWSETLL